MFIQIKSDYEDMLINLDDIRIFSREKTRDFDEEKKKMVDTNIFRITYYASDTFTEFSITDIKAADTFERKVKKYLLKVE